MHKLAAFAVVSGLTLASCGHGGSSALPPGAVAAAGAAHSALGTHTVRPKGAISAPAGWSATGTGAIAPANASDLGALAPNTAVNVTLGLQIRNVDALNSAIAARQVMSRSQFVSTYAPSPAQVQAAVSYLQSNGFTNVSATSNNMLVTATGTAAVVQKAFNTTLHSFSVGVRRISRTPRPRSSRARWPATSSRSLGSRTSPV
ncbi:MAG: hypothetical protein JOZ24_06030 [Candidatus Eremiobacteraeota bacterium]|nr:hypothetical protein [Candidatus Eremiobacteraeota bacterium]